MPQNAGVLYILPCKCASRHSGVPFFNIGTSKSGPSMWCFAHFDLKMCFAPQRRAIFRHRNFKKWSDHAHVVFCTFWPTNVLFATAAIFRHRNFKKWSDHEVFCTFWPTNVLFATAACHFSTSELQKVLRHRQFFSMFTSKCAFRHSGVHFSPVCWTATSAPAALASLLFEHQEPRIIEKT